jgi:thioredoxin-dependent adenylylsulfate APS reductase
LSESAYQLLSWAISTYGDGFAIATSFQKEGMAIIDIASRISKSVRVFTLDTGRLPEETRQMMDTVRSRYAFDVETVRPDPAEVAEMVSARGLNLFYDSVENRRLCCEIRKVRPLQRKLAGLQAWATGLRREQSADRAQTPQIERGLGPIKVNPLAEWTSAQLERYLQEHQVPLHPLYARGYATIGCDPCSRPIKPGEDARAGRWWWEDDSKKECGIHITRDGVVQRA